MEESSYIGTLGSKLSTTEEWDTFIIPLNGAVQVNLISCFIGGGSVPGGPGGASFRIGENFSPIPFRLPVFAEFEFVNPGGGTCTGFIVERRKRECQNG